VDTKEPAGMVFLNKFRGLQVVYLQPFLYVFPFIDLCNTFLQMDDATPL
jgi:hypothetical protein